MSATDEPRLPLHEATLRLLSLLATTRPENDLLQKGIEALAAILQVRYGAIALVDDAGKLQHFVHTGISAEDAAHIGRLPEGRGLLGVSTPLRLADMSHDPRSMGFPPNHPKMQSLLSTVFSHEGHTYGRVYLSEKNDGTIFSKDDEQLLMHFASVFALILAYHRAQTAREQSAATLREISHALSAITGEPFFRELVQNLARALDTAYAFVGEVTDANLRAIHTVAVCADGKLVDNFVYDLHGTPCENVVGKKVCFHAQGVQQLFPDDRMLVEMGIESYIGSPLFDSAGNPLGIIVLLDRKPLADPEHARAILQICAARAAAELERRRAETQMRQLSSAVEQTADSVVITDRDGVVQYVNPAFEMITGYTRDETVGKKASILKSGMHDEPFYQQLWDTISRGEVFRERLTNRRKNGTLYYEEKTITPLKNEKGEITHFVSTGKDITARMLAENENRRMQAFLNSVVENLPNMLFVKDAKDLRFVRFNKAAEELLGYSRAEMLGKSDHDFFPREEADFFTAKDRDVLSKGVPHDIPEEPVHTKHKGVRLLHTQKIPIMDETGKPLYLLGISEDITERKRAEEALSQSAAEWTYSMDFIDDSMCLIDNDGKIVRANKAFYKLMGLDPDQTIGRDIVSIMHPRGDSAPCRVCEARRARRNCHIIMEPQDSDNSTGRPIEVTLRIIRDAAHAPTGGLMVIRDLMPMRETERVLRESEISLANAQRIAHLGNWDWDIVTNQLRWSDEIYRIFGLTPREFGATYEAFLNAVHPDDKTVVIASVNRALHENQPYDIDHRIVRPDGTERIVREIAEVTFDESGKAIRMVGTVQDITDSRRAQERLNYLAYYDTLTGLPNRVLLQDRLHQAMLEARRRDRLVAVMFLDLDRFKIINDTLGHDVGDALLKEVAGRLTACVRAGDTISRLGGDEFTIILANVAHIDDVSRVAQKIVDCFIPPFQIAGREMFISTSIGITLFPLDDSSFESLMRNADAAMYLAKEMGRNTFQFYTAELNLRTARRLQLETALRHALNRHELLLHYQPQVNIKTGKIIGMEALLRWQHPEMGLIPPLDFIPLAEETGLIIPIGEWVLRTACHQARAWHQAGLRNFQVAVNLSGRQFQHRNLARLVKNILKETGLDPRYLDLELTESILMHNSETILATMNELHVLGVAFSMDDFGTGYSSLSYLKRFPIDTLKIDKSFVRDITTDPDDAAISQAIIAMSHGLGARVIAEGVETAKQLAFLRAHRCDAMQGYYFSKPVSADDMTQLLLKNSRPMLPKTAAGRKKRRKKKS